MAYLAYNHKWNNWAMGLKHQINICLRFSMIKTKAFHRFETLHCHIVRGRGGGNVRGKESGSMKIYRHDSGRNSCFDTRGGRITRNRNCRCQCRCHCQWLWCHCVLLVVVLRCVCWKSKISRIVIIQFCSLPALLGSNILPCWVSQTQSKVVLAYFYPLISDLDTFLNFWVWGIQ